jgi:hypothetical protein
MQQLQQERNCIQRPRGPGKKSDGHHERARRFLEAIETRPSASFHSRLCTVLRSPPVLRQIITLNISIYNKLTICSCFKNNKPLLLERLSRGGPSVRYRTQGEKEKDLKFGFPVLPRYSRFPTYGAVTSGEERGGGGGIRTRSSRRKEDKMSAATKKCQGGGVQAGSGDVQSLERDEVSCIGGQLWRRENPSFQEGVHCHRLIWFVLLSLPTLLNSELTIPQLRKQCTEL